MDHVISKVDMLFAIDHFLPLSAWSLAASMFTGLLWYQEDCSEWFTDDFQSVLHVHWVLLAALNWYLIQVSLTWGSHGTSQRLTH